MSEKISVYKTMCLMPAAVFVFIVLNLDLAN